MSSYELIIAQILTKGKYSFKQEKTFTDLKHGKYRFDFYLPNVNGGTCIEVDGEQHWKPIYGRKELLKSQAHDRWKNEYCLVHNVPLFRIPFWDIEKIKSVDDIFSSKYRVVSKYHNDDLKPPK